MQKFISGVAVVANGSIIHLQIFQCFEVVKKHGQRVCCEQDGELRFALPPQFFCAVALCNLLAQFLGTLVD